MGDAATKFTNNYALTSLAVAHNTQTKVGSFSLTAVKLAMLATHA